MNEQARYYVMNTEQFGRAVFAATDLKIGDVVMYCEVLPLNSADTFLVSLTELKHYVFTFKVDERLGLHQDCLVLGDGEMFNHDDAPHASYELISLNNRWLMVFKMVRDIKKDEQIMIDYNADVIEKKEDVLGSYNTNML